MVFDYSGCGQEAMAPATLESNLKISLSAGGWGNRAEVILIVPEIENWVFADSPHVARCLGWQARWGNMRTWMEHNNYWISGRAKPTDPRLAMEAVLEKARIPRSSSIYACIARSVSLRRCSDSAFLKLRRVLTEWFPALGSG